MNRFSEEESAGFTHRERALKNMETFIRERHTEADKKRTGYFTPDTSSVAAYQSSCIAYRTAFCAMLGWPLTEPYPTAPVQGRTVEAGRDNDGVYSRVWVEVLPGLETYGMLLVPHGPGPFPLVIDVHGGGGMSEWEMGLTDATLTFPYPRRFARKGCAVFAPQVLLWTNEARGPKFDRQHYDDRLKQTGSSITAIEIRQIQRSIDYLGMRSDISAASTALAGCSYGGFYALYAAAVDVRVKAVLSSCYINSRYSYPWPDWTWQNQALTFCDAEIAALVCPRHLYVELARNDTIFDFTTGNAEVEKIARWYERLGIGDRFCFRGNNDGHSPSPDDGGVEFICKALGL